MKFKVSAGKKQDGSERSFVGGNPLLPREAPWPVCEFCGREFVFFVTVSLGVGHAWDGYSVSLFSCVRCMDATAESGKGASIPEMLESIKNPIVSAEFLERYQTNFALIQFPTRDGVMREARAPGVAFSNLVPSNDDSFDVIIGGNPDWLWQGAEEEVPLKISEQPPVFLFQLALDYSFERAEGSPPQVTFGRVWEKRKVYWLFNSNARLFYGPEDPRNAGVYCWTQCD